ncbi:MAG TPA: O-antigen ligase family protein, partial [Desulfobacterales bacterium]|nr:O-antigen ligase family protein [Desulfobacterales bacterium]
AMGLVAWRLRVRLNAVDYLFSAGAAFALIAIGARSALQGAGVTDVVQRVASLFDVASGSVGERVAVWSGVLDAIAERPLMGFGSDTLMLVWGAHASAAAAGVVGAGEVDSAHNLPLHLAAGIGVVGAALYLAALVIALGIGVRVVRARGRDPRLLLCAGYIVALGTALLASLVSVTDVGLSVLMWLLAAGAATTGATVVPAKLRVPRATIAAALLVAAMGLTSAGVLVSADHAMARSRIAAGTDAGFEWAERAVARNPFNDEYRLELGLQHLDSFVTFVDRGEVARAAEHFAAAEVAFSELVAGNPRYVEGHLALAELYVWGARVLDGGYAASALRSAERARELAPGSPRTIGAEAIALAMQGRVAEAEAELRAGLEVMPGNAQLEEILVLVTGEEAP